MSLRSRGVGGGVKASCASRVLPENLHIISMANSEAGWAWMARRLRRILTRVADPRANQALPKSSCCAEV
jgi:hypothetical protein